MIDWNKIVNSIIVRSAYEIAIDNGESITLQAMASKLLKDGIIDLKGEPTKKAIKLGLVDGEPIKNPKTVDEYREKYPELKLVPDDCFKVVDGQVKIDGRGIKILGDEMGIDLIGEVIRRGGVIK